MASLETRVSSLSPLKLPAALSGVPAQRVAEAGRIRTARVVTVGEIARHLGAEG